MIVISQRIAFSEERGEVVDLLDHRLMALVTRLGMNAVPVPNVLSPEKRLSPWLMEIRPRGVILSGGNDIGEFLERDATESALIEYSKQHCLPLLGICRGMQMLAGWSGVPTKAVSHHVRSRHQINGEIFGEVNSYHKYSIASCPPGFKVTACSEDGEIEAIRHFQLPWEGWMWHPERENPTREEDLVRLRALFNG